MTPAKTRAPAVEGWFTLDAADGEPRLLGTRCTTCSTFFFPPATGWCRNPACDGTELEPVPLSRTGRIWSWTVNRYAPPPPYIAADPFEPYAIAAVELVDEKLVVMGQATTTDLHVGQDVELVVDRLYEDDEKEYVVWKWSPA